jgi:lysophospholipase L1-like esterase
MTGVRVLILLCITATSPACIDATAFAGEAPPEGKRALPRMQARLAAGQEVRIVCFGDSVTGVYYHTGGRRAYTDMVAYAIQGAFPEARVEMVNAGISGNTTADALARLDRDVLSQRPHLVTVMFGLNDMVRVPIDEFRGNLRKIIDRCHAAGAEVLLCTPNGIIDTRPRPVARLVEYCEAIRVVGAKESVPVCDCYAAYAALEARDPRAWRLLLSDEIHPNMDGHKVLAEAIGRSITGKAVSLRDVGPPQPAIPRTLALLKAGKPVHVLAMPTYDRLIAAALEKVEPSARVEVTLWPTAGRSLAQIEEAARQVRSKKVDLVLVAVPASAAVESREQVIRSLSWVLNGSLSFGKQEWDVVGIAPSVAKARLTAAEQEQEERIRRLIHAQDLSLIERRPGEDAPAEGILEEWLRRQSGSGKK